MKFLSSMGRKQIHYRFIYCHEGKEISVNFPVHLRSYVKWIEDSGRRRTQLILILDCSLENQMCLHTKIRHINDWELVTNANSLGHPRHAKLVVALPTLWQSKISPHNSKCPLEAKSSLVENPWTILLHSNQSTLVHNYPVHNSESDTQPFQITFL